MRRTGARRRPLAKEDTVFQRHWLILLICVAVVPSGRPWAASEGPTGVDSRAAFERLKGLQGTWEAPLADGRSAETTFELTASGTVLLERYANPALPAGSEMITAYHLDGPDLVLTHYCMANNQPTLRVERFDPATGVIQFEFVRASNLASPQAGHMRRAKYTLVDADRFITEWEFFENGRKTMTEVDTFTRKR
jgi:hypothetical protein